MDIWTALFNDIVKAIENNSKSSLYKMAKLVTYLKNEEINSAGAILLTRFLTWFSKTKSLMNHYDLGEYLFLGQEVVNFWNEFDADYVDLVTTIEQDTDLVIKQHRELEESFKLCRKITTIDNLKRLISSVYTCYHVTDHSRIILWLDSPGVKTKLFKIIRGYLDPLAIYGLYKFCKGTTLYSHELWTAMSFYCLFHWMSPSIADEYKQRFVFTKMTCSQDFPEEMMIKARNVGLIDFVVPTNKMLVSDHRVLKGLIEDGLDVNEGNGLIFSALLYGKHKALPILGEGRF
jgi:hypothetical protein